MNTHYAYNFLYQRYVRVMQIFFIHTTYSARTGRTHEYTTKSRTHHLMRCKSQHIAGNYEVNKIPAKNEISDRIRRHINNIPTIMVVTRFATLIAQ